MTSGFQAVYCPSTCPSEVKHTRPHFFICSYTPYAFHTCSVVFAQQPGYKLATYFLTTNKSQVGAFALIYLCGYIENQMSAVWRRQAKKSKCSFNTVIHHSVSVWRDIVIQVESISWFLSVESEDSFYNQSLNSRQRGASGRDLQTVCWQNRVLALL